MDLLQLSRGGITQNSTGDFLSPLGEAVSKRAQKAANKSFSATASEQVCKMAAAMGGVSYGSVGRRGVYADEVRTPPWVSGSHALVVW